MSNNLSYIASLANGILSTLGGFLLIFGTVVAVTGFASDRSDQITQGLWVLASGGILLGLGSIIGNVIMSQASSISGSMPQVSLKVNWQSWSDISKTYSNLHAPGVFAMLLITNMIIAIKVLGVNIPLYIVSQISSQNGSFANMLATVEVLLLSVADTLYAYFALEELIMQYKHISQLGGGGLMSLGIPFQLIIRLGIPLTFLNEQSLKGITGLFLSIGVYASSHSIASIQNNNVLDNILRNLANTLGNMNLLTQLLVAIIMVVLLILFLFSVGSIAGVSIGAATRFIGFAMALPIGIASFASQDFDSLGKTLLKRFLGAALEFSFIIMGTYIGFAVSILAANAIIKSGSGFIGISFALAILVFSLKAGAEAGQRLGREVF